MGGSQGGGGTPDIAFELRGVSCVRPQGTVLRDIDAAIPGARATALVGPSGSGKTTLLRLLNRLDEPTGGLITYRSEPLETIPVRQLRCRVGFVFQEPAVFPGSVRDNLEVAAELAGIADGSREARIAEALGDAGLDEGLAGRAAERLSGGEKQRLTIARALVSAPEVLLMDEPTSALDAAAAQHLMRAVGRLCRTRALTVLFATHRLGEARRFGDHVLALDGGRVVAAGPPEEVLNGGERGPGAGSAPAP